MYSHTRSPISRSLVYLAFSLSSFLDPQSPTLSFFLCIHSSVFYTLRGLRAGVALLKTFPAALTSKPFYIVTHIGTNEIYIYIYFKRKDPHTRNFTQKRRTKFCTNTHRRITKRFKTVTQLEGWRLRNSTAVNKKMSSALPLFPALAVNGTVVAFVG